MAEVRVVGEDGADRGADGCLFLVDRKKDMVITGGLNVYTSEVEQALDGIEGVGQVAVAGVPHPD